MGRHDCAQVERDCLDLHKALAEALRRIGQLTRAGGALGGLLDGYAWPTVGHGADMRRAIEEHRMALVSGGFTDLIAVLDRTSRPGAGVRPWQWPDDEDNLPQGVDLDMVPKA